MEKGFKDSLKQTNTIIMNNIQRRVHLEEIKSGFANGTYHMEELHKEDFFGDVKGFEKTYTTIHRLYKTEDIHFTDEPFYEITKETYPVRKTGNGWRLQDSYRIEFIGRYRGYLTDEHYNDLMKFFQDNTEENSKNVLKLLNQ